MSQNIRERALAAEASFRTANTINDEMGRAFLAGMDFALFLDALPDPEMSEKVILWLEEVARMER
jgi:hypothetical protein